MMSRARTASGAVQPLEQQWNPGGYLCNVAPRVSVQVGPESYRRTCYVCHDGHMMQSQRLTRTKWEKEVDKMGKCRSADEPRKSASDHRLSQQNVQVEVEVIGLARTSRNSVISTTNGGCLCKWVLLEIGVYLVM
jgi:cytochrome c1